MIFDTPPVISSATGLCVSGCVQALELCVGLLCEESACMHFSSLLAEMVEFWIDSYDGRI